LNAVLMLELAVGIIVSFALLALLIWAIRDGQFEDRKRMMDGLLYDGVDELRDAVEREKKREGFKRKKIPENRQITIYINIFKFNCFLQIF